MMKNTIAIAFATAAVSFAAFADVRTVKMEPGENWWGAANFFGTKMPFTEKTDLKIDLRRRNYSNQCASMLVSDRGRVIWSDAQSEIAIKDGAITMDDDLLVAPMLKKGATSRTVVLPPGAWKADDGQVYNGPATIEVAAPLSRLPYFVKRTVVEMSGYAL